LGDYGGGVEADDAVGLVEEFDELVGDLFAEVGVTLIFIQLQLERSKHITCLNPLLLIIEKKPVLKPVDIIIQCPTQNHSELISLPLSVVH